MRFGVKLWIKPFTLYAGFENLNYIDAHNIISNCLNNGDYATVKVNNTNYHIENNTQFRYFVEEFGYLERKSENE